MIATSLRFHANQSASAHLFPSGVGVIYPLSDGALRSHAGFPCELIGMFLYPRGHVYVQLLRGMLFGHLHSDEWRADTAALANLGVPFLLSSAVTPIYDNNPSFKVSHGRTTRIGMILCIGLG